MKIIRLLLLLLFVSLFAGCNSGATEKSSGTNAAEADYERGPHGGRMLRKDDFAIEIVLYEKNAEPHYRLYAYQKDNPLLSKEVQASVRLTRLDGEVTLFWFKPEKDYLKGDAEVAKPYSFDVVVKASSKGKQYEWDYPSYEGRTIISDNMARETGIRVAPAGPAVLKESVQLLGNVVLDPSRHTLVRARFPGTVRAVRVKDGDRIRRGQTLVTIEGNESMREYPVTAPFDGVVLARYASVGDMADTNTLLEIADLSNVWVELHAMGETAARLRAGQKVAVRSATGNIAGQTKIDTIMPLTTRGQSVVVRATLPNKEGIWRPGMTVASDIIVAEKSVPLAVKESALQRFRDFTVVFAQIGETYEARMLKLGMQDGEYAEVISGIKPETNYVTEQSFLIKADIEKSSASQDH